ncbi:MAG TPA: hypothetical protein VK793_18545 [Steroidobacteraceae bacterium]|jgi:hypothetical protein|nr:hypothetical protein [Steroidobacteraceae bacterium]
MDATLDETVERAKEEVKKLLAEVQAGQPDPKKLECGLMEVQGRLKVLDIHLESHRRQ